MSNQELITEDEQSKTIDINKIITILLARWYLIVGCMVLAAIIAFVQLRYSKPTFKATTSLKFEDERGSQVSDLFKYGRITGRIENIMKTESEVLKSRNMSKKTLIYLGLQTSEFIEGNFITSRLYPNRAFKVNIALLDSGDIGKSFKIKLNGDNTFDIIEGDKNRKVNFGDTIHMRKSLFVINSLSQQNLNEIKNLPVTIAINNLENMGSSMARSLDIELEKNTNIMNLEFTADIAEYAKDFVNALTQVYIEESIKAKTSAAKQTISYIDLQLIELSKSVAASQKDLSSFKSTNKGMEPKELGKAEFEKLLELETERNILGMRKKQLQQLEKEVIRSKNNPIELVVVDAEDGKAISTLIEALNQFILERISYSGKYSKESPIMKENEQKINELKAGTTRAIKAVEASIDNNINNVSQQIGLLNSSLSDLPSKEQNLFNLERTFKINEKIYGYLQERRLENMIGISSIISNITVIDEALPNNTPISPNPQKNYIIAILIGLSVGIGSIFFSRIIYNKIPDKETIESISRIPVIGVIRRIENEQKTSDYGIYVYQNPKSLFAESIRGIRTNVNFLLKGDRNKVICITSSVSGEGKTFCTVNIAASVTQLGYKVVIVGCDLRRPKLHESFDSVNNLVGLTNYLVKRATIDEIIFETGNPNLFIVPAGPTPPNPSELLQTQEFETFIEELKKRFDYVFLDTAPVGLVSDSLNLMVKADINLFVIRAQYSKREFASIPDKLSAENNIKNVYTILNSFDSSAIIYSSLYKYDYGNYYGGRGYYYYGGYYDSGYGSKTHRNHYANYYSEEPKKINRFTNALKSLFKKKNS